MEKASARFREARKSFRKYIAKMNRVSVILIVAGVFAACALFLCSLLLFHNAAAFSSPMKIVMLSERLFETGATLFLTAPLCAFLLDLFSNALRKK